MEASSHILPSSPPLNDHPVHLGGLTERPPPSLQKTKVKQPICSPAREIIGSRRMRNEHF